MSHIPTCLDAVIRQTYPKTMVTVVDNASLDRVMEWLREHTPQIHLIRNTRNVGFARGHNQAMRVSTAPYLLVLNPDVVLEPHWIERAVAAMEADPKVAAIGGRLIRFEYSSDDLKEVVPSGIIDSTGLVISRSRHVRDRGAGERDTGQYQDQENVFGLSGACVMYRRAALDEVKEGEQYFDEDFFAYKEDVDLSWRLLRRGWLNRYEPSLIAYHHRHARSSERTSNRALAQSHQARNIRISRLSYRNHWWLLIKNERPVTLFRDLPWIAWYELKKFMYLMVTAFPALRGGFSALSYHSRMRRKAHLIDQNARMTPSELRRLYFLH